MNEREAEVVEFLRGRSEPCPKCGYDLRDVPEAKCPECAEPLVLKVGSPKPRVGWLVVAVVPGAFSGVAAILLAIPIYRSVGLPPGKGVPTAVMIAEGFGIFSVAAAIAIVIGSKAVLSWRTKRQAGLAITIWLIHVGAFVALLAAM